MFYYLNNVTSSIGYYIDKHLTLKNCIEFFENMPGSASIDCLLASLVVIAPQF